MGKHEDGRVYRDVHLVIRHPTQLNTLYATTGIGTYITIDNGRTWSKRASATGLRSNWRSIPMRRIESFWQLPKNGPTLVERTPHRSRRTL